MPNNKMMNEKERAKLDRIIHQKYLAERAANATNQDESFAAAIELANQIGTNKTRDLIMEAKNKSTRS
jgi:hypothetical protein